MINQLPAEVAQNLKLYNRKSEAARHSGRDDGKEDNVLDINIKPGFMDKWYGTASVNYMTDRRYKGEVNGSYLSDHDPRRLYLQMNNENRNLENNARWTRNRAISNYGKSQYGSYTWYHYWKTSGMEKFRPNSLWNTASMSHVDGWKDEHSILQTFLPGEERTWRESTTSSGTHKFSPQLMSGVFAYVTPKNSVYIDVVAAYTKQEDHSETRQENHSGSAAGEMISSQHEYNSTTEEKADVKMEYDWTHYVGVRESQKVSFGVRGDLSYNNGSIHEHVTRELNYARQGLDDNSYQYFRTPSRSFGVTFTPNVAMWLAKHIYFELDDEVSYATRRSHRDAYADRVVADMLNPMPVTVDMDNKNRSVGHDWGNSLRASFNLELAKGFNVTPSLTWRHFREQLSYSYGSLDTATVRHTSFLLPRMEVSWKVDRFRKFNFSYRYETTHPALAQTFDYSDTTDPLYVRMGNSQLKRSHSYNLDLNFTRIWPRRQTVLTFGAAYQHNINPLTSLYAYNPQTAAYILKPMNIRGGGDASFGLNLDQGLGFFFRLLNNAKVNIIRRYGYLSQTGIEQQPALNRQRVTMVNNDFTFSYERSIVQLSVYDKLTWSRYRYDASADANSAPLRMSYGANTRVKPGHFEFYVNFYDDYRSGYLVDAMNGHRWIVNAGAIWKFCKNKMRLALDANDIFNRERERTASYSAYETSEQWSQHLHHYIALTFTYTHDAKAKKRR